jgi:Glycosyl transferase 4-like domain
MRTVLIVSPCFPPVSAPEMQRVRMGLPYFSRFGWKPIVLAVEPRFIPGVVDPLLLESVPPEIEIDRVRAIPGSLARRAGLGDLGMRSFPFLFGSGARLMEDRSIDLVYFSTTVFSVTPLGRLWKQRFRIPFVVDMQDPWVTDYWKTRQNVRRGAKARIADTIHGLLEPWTMPEADGLIAVSEDYIHTLQARYPRLNHVPCMVLPFGASEADFAIVRKTPQLNPFFSAGSGHFHGVYAGRGGADMEPALRIIFGALRQGLSAQPEIFSRVRLHFIGTSYAADQRKQNKTIEPVARELGVADQVVEHPARVPYFQALQLLLDAGFLIVPGSDDSQYTASKIYPYILSRKPLLAVFHERSSVCDILRRTRAGTVVSFNSQNGGGGSVDSLYRAWGDLLRSLPCPPPTDWQEFRPYSAEEMVRKQCALFDAVIARAGRN